MVKLERGTLEKHPDRAKLALLSASAHQQQNDHAAARRLVNLAKSWGCDKRMLAQLLVSGIHNTLGRDAALTHEGARALAHFRSAVEELSGAARLACQARSVRKVTRLGRYRDAARRRQKTLGQLR